MDNPESQHFNSQPIHLSQSASCSGERRHLCLLGRRHFWAVGIIGIGCLVPLALLQLKFGAFNIASVLHRADRNVSRFSAEGLLWYIERLPEMSTPLVSVGMALALPSLVVLGRQRRLNMGLVLLIVWALSAFAFLSLVHLKETRHSLIMLLPLGMLSVSVLVFLENRRWVATSVAMLLALNFAWVIAEHPTPRVSGIREAARLAVENLPRGSRLVFSGKEDGSFIFAVRESDPERKTQVVRVDKLLLDIKIMPQLGLNARDFSEPEIASMLNRFGIGVVVASPTLWSETPVMRRLQSVLNSGQFEVVGKVPVSGENRNPGVDRLSQQIGTEATRRTPATQEFRDVRRFILS